MTPIDYFDQAASETPAKPALIDGDVGLSFQDVVRLSQRVARQVSILGGNEPVQVVVYGPNDYRLLVVMIGVMRAGGIIVPVHAGTPVGTVGRLLEQVHPRLGYFHSSVSERVETLRVTSGNDFSWICLDRGQDSVSAASTEGTRANHLPRWIDATGNRERPIYYWVTSGTDGEPKVVVDDGVTFGRALMFIREQERVHGTNIVSLVVAPLTHGAGPHSFAMLSLGGTVIVPREFNARAVLELIDQHRVTHMWLPPTALYLLLDSPTLRSRDLSSLRSVQMGTAAVAPSRLREAVSAFGQCMSQTYGQIETGFEAARPREQPLNRLRGTSHGGGGAGKRLALCDTSLQFPPLVVTQSPAVISASTRHLGLPPRFIPERDQNVASTG
jgi:acyl-coenzyme A synthetase/AMP-(fatty) acid ligase